MVAMDHVFVGDAYAVQAGVEPLARNVTPVFNVVYQHALNEVYTI